MMIERTFTSNEQVAEVRSWAAEFCTKAEVARDIAEDVVLVVSELTTNCLRHTASAREGGCYTVRLTRGSSRVLVEVSDQGAPTAPVVRRHADGDVLLADSGRGLALVEAFSYRWWARGGQDGRTVVADVGPAVSGLIPEPRAGV